MKKFMFILMVAFVSGFSKSVAQKVQVATLSHNGDITTYYGSEAFIEAYDASDAGDIITLSSGTFDGTDIKKKLTIRGAGMEADTQNGILPTIIKRSYSNISIEGDSIMLEGINFGGTAPVILNKLNKAIFKKTLFRIFSSYSYNSEIMFNNCIVTLGSYSKFYKGKNWSFLNSYIWQEDYAYFGSSSYPDDRFDFLNCYVYI